MINSVEQYLGELKRELAGADRATIQDALSDAEEYLRTALSNMPSGTGVSDAQALLTVIDKYGAPADIAAAYRQNESRISPALDGMHAVEPQGGAHAIPGEKDKRPFLARFFGVLAEPRAWGAFFYLMIAMITGIIYFTWVVTGLSLSLGLLVLIIGLPIAGLFLLSVRGIALMEGRLVEALLGVRMPRRPRFSGKTGIWQRFKSLVTDRHTWFSMIYMVLQMPLGIFYFSLFVTLMAASLTLVAWPIAALVMGVPVFVVSPNEYYATGWLIPVSIVAGGLLLTVTMHLAKAIGKGHGAMAKALLVRL